MAADDSLEVLSAAAYRDAVEAPLYVALHDGPRPSLYDLFARGHAWLLQKVANTSAGRDSVAGALCAELLARASSRKGELPSEECKAVGADWVETQRRAEYKGGLFFVPEAMEDEADGQVDEEEQRLAREAAFCVNCCAHFCGSHAALHAFPGAMSLSLDTRASLPCFQLSCVSW